jgi:hypothetical protein
MPTQPQNSQNWPGKQLGLPERGPRSVARLGRRVGAIAIDWIVANVIAIGFFGWSLENANPFPPLVVFGVLQVLFICTLGGSVGHLVLGMRVVPVEPGWVGVIKPIARTALLCLGVPALIWDRDQRGMHDRIVGTVLVRR